MLAHGWLVAGIGGGHCAAMTWKPVPPPLRHVTVRYCTPAPADAVPPHGALHVAQSDALHAHVPASHACVSAGFTSGGQSAESASAPCVSRHTTVRETVPAPQLALQALHAVEVHLYSPQTSAAEPEPET